MIIFIITGTSDPKKNLPLAHLIEQVRINYQIYCTTFVTNY